MIINRLQLLDEFQTYALLVNLDNFNLDLVADIDNVLYLLEQNNITRSLAHTKWNCKYHIVFASKYLRKVFYEEKRMEIREILRKLC